MLQLVHLCAATLSRLKGRGGGPGTSSNSGVAPYTLAMLDILTRHRSHQAKELSETLGVVAGKLPSPTVVVGRRNPLGMIEGLQRLLGPIPEPLLTGGTSLGSIDRS